MAFTSRDVARLAGVSQSTVSYVMSGNRPISEETRRRVRAAIDELTYQPNAGARALASQRTRVIGLVAPFSSTSDPAGLLPFIETITATAREHDHDVLLVTADEGPAALTRLASRSLVDAIVLMEIADHDDRIEVAAGLRVPVVLVGVPEDPMGLPCVDLDFERAAALAVDELALAGVSGVVVLGHPAPVAARGLGYVRRFARAAERATARHGLEHHLVVPEEGTREAVGEAVAAALALGPGTGLLVPHSASVPAVLSALRGAGAVPGRDLAVVALCADSAAEESDPQVTNVSMEPRDVSRRAMRTLFRRLAGEHDAGARSTELVTPHLTRRATTPG